MRKIDKKNVLNNANLLSEQRYLQSKGLIKESEYLGGEMLNDFLLNLTPEDKNSLKSIVWGWFKWDPSRMSKFEKNEGNLRFMSNGKNAISYNNILEIGGNSYKLNGATMNDIKNHLMQDNGMDSVSEEAPIDRMSNSQEWVDAQQNADGGKDIDSLMSEYTSNLYKLEKPFYNNPEMLQRIIKQYQNHIQQLNQINQRNQQDNQPQMY